MDKIQDVYQKLSLVYDPELDQSLTELGFIDDVLIYNDEVEVKFRLPTYWCSPNFAFIMAEDIYRYVNELNWVKDVKVQLIEHCASEEINKGVTNGKEFSEAIVNFGGSEGNLEELRMKFQIKAFYARQEKLIKYLIHHMGFSIEYIISMTIEDLQNQRLNGEGSLFRSKYVEKKNMFNHENQLAFTTPEGLGLTKDTFNEYLLGIKRTRISMEFNGHYCRGLLEARYNLSSSSKKVSVDQ